MLVSRAVAAVCAVACGTVYGETPAPAPCVELVCVDAEADVYGTFQSHNQKVVTNAHGTFMTHIRSRNASYTAQQWRLSRSKDDGATFETIFEDTHPTNPPVLETDRAGNVYLARVDFEGGDAYLYRFLAEDGFHEPAISLLPGGAAGKYAMLLDDVARRLYFFSHNGRFFTLDFEGEVLHSSLLLRQGEHGALQYPSLTLGEDGAVHAAWTTVKHGDYLYWDIHHLVSRDHGRTWRNAGEESELALPIVADDTGPAARVSMADEFDSHTWLSNVMHHRGALHFLYLAQTTPPRQHYVRIDAKTGAETLRIQPRFGGDATEIRSLDGFLAADESTGTLYAVGAHDGRIVCLRSTDNGDTWTGVAESGETFTPYAIGGCRWVTTTGHVVGTFTDASGNQDGVASAAKVYFFRIAVRPAA